MTASMRSGPVAVSEFDLRELNIKMAAAQRTKRAVAVGLELFLVALGLVAFSLYGGQLISGTISLLRLVTLIIVLSIVVSCTMVIVPGIIRTLRHADWAKISSEGLELRLSPSRLIYVRWGDPKLAIDLFDSSQTPSSAFVVEIRHTMRTALSDSALTPQAFDSILSEAQNRGLQVTRTRGSRWIYPAAVAPTMYLIRGPRGRRNAIN